jgi:hypothetical protein
MFLSPMQAFYLYWLILNISFFIINKLLAFLGCFKQE